MELLLNRTTYDSKSTEGVLTGVNFECYTLEPPFTDGGHGSAISEGRYKIILAASPKFLTSTDEWVQKFAHAMPHLVDVPGRTAIMVHFGNRASDTEGCILVGEKESVDFIGASRAAFEEFYNLLAETQEDVYITIQRMAS